MKGLAVGILGTALVVTVIGWAANSLGSLFQPTIAYDGQARAAIVTKFPLTDTCTGLFYYSSGMTHFDTYMAFSGPQQALDAIVTTFAGKPLSAFKQWPASDTAMTDGKFHPWPCDAYRVMYYNLSEVRHGLFTGEYGRAAWQLVYDREHGRVLYHAWE
jgi:hypothetical protein